MPQGLGSHSRRRVLLLGDGLWAAAALEHLRRRHLPVGVVERCRPTDGSLSKSAFELGYTPCRWENINSAAARAWIASLQPELLISVSFDQIFTKSLLLQDSPTILNLHAGHPNRHRGRAVLTWQLLEGARSIDVTVMRVTRAVDEGPVLAARQVTLAPDDDYGRALELISAQVPDLLETALLALDSLKNPAPDERQEAMPAYYPRRLPGDEWVDWGRSSEEILRQIRALAPPNPMARTRLGGVNLFVRRASPCPGFPVVAGIPGSVIGREPGKRSLVKTGDGAIWLDDVRDESGSAPLPRLSDRLGGSMLAEIEELRRRVRQLEDSLAIQLDDCKQVTEDLS